jgi:hypothetical protein
MAPVIDSPIAEKNCQSGSGLPAGDGKIYDSRNPMVQKKLPVR